VSSVSPEASPPPREWPARLPRRTQVVAALAVALGALLMGCGEEAEGSPTLVATVTAAATEAPPARTPRALDTVTPDPDGADVTPQSTQATNEAQYDDGQRGDRPAPLAAANLAPDSDVAMVHLRYLVESVGPRPAGSQGEREAADYIADVLRDAGYETTVDEFEFETSVDESSVDVGDTNLRAFAMQGSANAEVRGLAVFAGIGEPGDLAMAHLDGAVVVFDRGSVTFREKVTAAVAGGAVAVVIVNDEDGPFRGSLGGLSVSIPVVAVAGDGREALQEALGRRITVRAEERRDRRTSQNVVASVDGQACQGYLGAHYDSVPQGPGANDNASGTAVVLELARVNARPGLCVVAFGAEEVGLFGSQNYVREHLAGTARFMLNVDMAGRLDGPIIVGDSALTEAVLDAIREAQAPPVLRAGTFPPFASSDHVSFSAVGVPAVTFNSGDDVAIHTERDGLDRIDPAALEVFLRSVDAALDALLPVAAPAP